MTKKRLLSLMLCLTMVITTLTGITFQVAAADDGLTLIDQKFYDDSTGTAVALTEAPSGWTVTGTGHTWRTTGLSPGHHASVGATQIYKNDVLDTNGAEYTFSVNFRHMSNTQYIHWGAATVADASKEGVADTGYTFTATMLGSGTNAYKSGVYKLYKNGTQLEVDLTDVNTSYGYQKNRTFNFKVTSTGIEISGAAFNGTITVADTTPITQGYVGASLSNNNSGSLANCAVGFMKLVKPLVVDEASNVIPTPVLVDGTTPVKIAFNGAIEPSTVNTTNAYLTDTNGNKLDDSMYTVALEGDRTIAFTPSTTNQLKYKTTYKAVVTTGITSTGGIALGANKEYLFTTENPPFEVLTTLNNGTDDVVEASANGDATDVTSLAGQKLTLKYFVSNTERYMYGDKSAYAIVSFENASGKALKTVAKKVEVPSRGAETSYVALTTDESVTIPADATVMRSYIVTADLDNYYPMPDTGAVISDATVSYTDDTVTVSGVAGTTAGKDVYLMMMNMKDATTPYVFDTTVANDVDFGKEIQKFAKTTTGANGAFTFTIPMNVSGATAADWRFYIGGDEYSTAQMQTFYFVNSEAKNNIIADINAASSAEEILTILEDTDKMKALGLDDNALMNALQAEDVAYGNNDLMTALAKKLLDVAPFDENDGGVEFINALNEQAIYVAIANDIRNVIVDSEGQFTAEADEVLGFDTLDSINGTTVTRVFEDELSTSAQTAVLYAFMGSDYSSVEDIYEVFKNNVMVKGFACVTDITDFLRNNAAHFGIDISVYNTLNSEQMTATNNALKAATPDPTSKETVRTSIQAVIDSVISTFDLTTYSYTFSAADGVSTEWSVSNNGSFSDDKGYTTEYSYRSSLISPESRLFSGNYLLTSDVSRNTSSPSSQIGYYFNYIDGNNYCCVEFSYSKGITLLRRQDGMNITYANASEYANVYANYEKNAQIIVENEGYVTVKDSSGKVLINRTYVGAPLAGGRVGIMFYYVPASVKTIAVKNCLETNNVVESGQADMVDTELAPTFTGRFNYPVNADTVNLDTVRILDVDGNVIEGAIDSVSLSNNGFEFTVTVKAGVLDYKTDYYLNLTTGVQLAIREDSFVSDVKLLFNTKAPELNITSMYDSEAGNTMVFTNDIARYRENYVTLNPLSMIKGQFFDLYMKGENTGSTDKTVDIYVTIEDGTKTYNVEKVANVTLAAGATGWITPSGINVDEEKLTSIAVPDDVSAEAKVRFYVMEDESKLTTAYPFVANSAVTDNGERPSFMLVGSKLTVQGNTFSGLADRNVNMIITDDAGVAKVIVTTKTVEKGAYSFNVDLDTEFIASGTYHIYIGGQDYAAKVTPVGVDNAEQILVYIDDADRNALIATINGAADSTDILAVLVNDANLVALGLNANTIVTAMKDADKTNGNNALMAALAKRIYDEKTSNPFAEDGGAEFRNRVAEISVYTAIEQNFKDAIVDENGLFTAEADEVLGLDAFDDGKEPCTTFNAVYENEFSIEKRNAVLSHIMGKAYDNAADVYVDFADAVMVNALNDSNVDINNLLLDNAEYYNLDLTEYKQLDNSKLASLHASMLSATFDVTDVANSIQAFINSEIKTYDMSVYEYKFSAADTIVSGDTTPSGWYVNQNVGREGTFTDDYGYRVVDTDNQHFNQHYLISSENITATGDYILSATGYRAYSYFKYFFNYVDSSDYYYVEFTNGSGDDSYLTKPVHLKSKTGVTIASNLEYTGGYSNAQIIVEKAGYVTVRTSTGDEIIPRTYVGSTLNGGRFGAGLENTPGYIRSISVKKYLAMDAIVEEGQDEAIDVAIAPVLTGEFNYPVDAATVTTDTVKILDVDGNVIEGAVDSVTVSNDGLTLTVTVKEGVLNYETNYYLNVTTGVKMKLRDCSFANDVKLAFNTNECGNFYITDIVNQNGEDIDALNLTSLTKITFNANLYYDTTEDVRFIAAFYDRNGKLIKTFFDDFTLEEMVTPISIDVENVSRAIELRIYSWSGFNNMIPLRKPEIIG